MQPAGVLILLTVVIFCISKLRLCKFALPYAR